MTERLETRDRETGRHRDRETERQGDKETERQGDRDKGRRALLFVQQVTKCIRNCRTFANNSYTLQHNVVIKLIGLRNSHYSDQYAQELHVLLLMR